MRIHSQGMPTAGPCRPQAPNRLCKSATHASASGRIDNGSACSRDYMYARTETNLACIHGAEGPTNHQKKGGLYGKIKTKKVVLYFLIPSSNIPSHHTDDTTMTVATVDTTACHAMPYPYLTIPCHTTPTKPFTSLARSSCRHIDTTQNTLNSANGSCGLSKQSTVYIHV